MARHVAPKPHMENGQRRAYVLKVEADELLTLILQFHEYIKEVWAEEGLAAETEIAEAYRD